MQGRGIKNEVNNFELKGNVRECFDREVDGKKEIDHGVKSADRVGVGGGRSKKQPYIGRDLVVDENPVDPLTAPRNGRMKHLPNGTMAVRNHASTTPARQLLSQPPIADIKLACER